LPIKPLAPVMSIFLSAIGIALYLDCCIQKSVVAV
jgi:hypothetical protein